MPSGIERPYIDPVEAKGWHFYDVTSKPGPLDRTEWDVLQEHGPAGQILDGGRYVLAPHHEPDQQLGEAYKVANALFVPCLRLRDPASDDYPGLFLRFSPRFAIFSRLALGAAHVRLYTPDIPNVQSIDQVLLDIHTGPAVFARDFDIMPMDEFMRASRG